MGRRFKISNIKRIRGDCKLKRFLEWLFVCALLFLFGFGIYKLTIIDSEVTTRDVKSCILEENEHSYSSGTFVLGFGVYGSGSSIETEYYMYIKGNEGFRLQKINSDYLEIVETDDVEPCIKGDFYSDGKVEQGNNYIIYLPVGTIKEEYKVNLE